MKLSTLNNIKSLEDIIDEDMGAPTPATPECDGSGDLFVSTTGGVAHGFTKSKKKKKKRRLKNIPTLKDFLD